MFLTPARESEYSSKDFSQLLLGVYADNVMRF